MCLLFFSHCFTYFDGKGAPWEVDKIDPKTPKRMKFPNSDITDYEIVECCWILLKANSNYFKHKWNWSDFMKKYIHNKDKEICW